MATILTDATLHLAALRHFEADRLSEAATICTTILSGTPDDWLALRLLGAVRSKEGDCDQAVRLLTAALDAAPRANPDAATMLTELAEALLGMQDIAGALACCRRALDLSPSDASVRLNYGNILVAMNLHGEALRQYDFARVLEPTLAQARVNEGLTMLALGMWPQAWGMLEARLSIPSINLLQLMPADVPHWRGEVDLCGKIILLHAEQGLGDTLQYVRYLSDVATRGGRVVLRVQSTLTGLLAEMPGAETVISYDQVVPAVDLQCPLMSLPLAFGTTVATVPTRVPYITVPRQTMIAWQALFAPRQCRRIGIAWSSGPRPPLRSMPLATLAPLLTAGSDLEFHSLQKEMPDTDRAWLEAHDIVVDHSAQQKDFADAAGLIAHMDLVISVDTSLAHLAGALGKPVWFMLPFSADSRWLRERTDTPWYPTARLFRQKRPGHWDGVVADVVETLRQRPPIGR